MSLVPGALVVHCRVGKRQRARLSRVQSNGLPVSWLSGFTQDTNGFFWFGTAAGLYRFDGVEFRQWAKGKIGGWHYQVFPGQNGEVLLTCLPDSTLYRVLAQR